MRLLLGTALVSLSIVLTSCSGRRPPPLDAALQAELKAAVLAGHAIPELYILNLFYDHDVVFLGEHHSIRHDPILVRKLIPLLYERGIRFLCTEFARRIDQPLVDSLLDAPVYDEALARLITFRQSVHFGFQEYVDIYRAAWQLNRNIPAGAKRFRILALNNAPDWSVVEKDADRDNPEIMKKVWHGEDESDWARVILDRVVARGERALVYCGLHHAFTEYRQPVVSGGDFIRFGDVRAGNHVYDAIGKRAVTITLHAPWPGAEGYEGTPVKAGDGAIDALLADLEPEYRRFGIDTRETPFGRITGSTAVFHHGYENFTLAAFCDGYVCQGPLAGYEGVTPIRDFVNEANIEEARKQSPDPRFRNASPEEFARAAARTANVRGRMPL